MLYRRQYNSGNHGYHLVPTADNILAQMVIKERRGDVRTSSNLHLFFGKSIRDSKSIAVLLA
jgi:hypothetical protein